MSLTLIVPYYRQPRMLARQAAEWCHYPPGLKIIVVDDGSPEPAESILGAGRFALPGVSLYRIDVDIPWNRNGARNLGAHVATTEWIMQVDIDHVMPAINMQTLLEELHRWRAPWYRFERFRHGQADETRKKDAIPDGTRYGKIKPHIDSYIMRREAYLKLGGYDERYAGCLGGGGVFLQRAVAAYGTPAVLPYYLEVYTRSEIPDSSEHTLSRDTAEYGRRKKLYAHLDPIAPLNFPWHKVF